MKHNTRDKKDIKSNTYNKSNKTNSWYYRVKHYRLSMQNSWLLLLLESIITTWLSSSRDFLIDNRLLLIIIYIIFIISLVIRLRYTDKIMISSENIFNKKLDDLWYQCSAILYKEKNNIHDISNTLPLLLHNKSSYAKEGKPYRLVIDKLIEEWEYIAQLTDKTIQIDKHNLQRTASFCKKLHAIEHNIKWTLAFISLWISKIFIK